MKSIMLAAGIVALCWPAAAEDLFICPTPRAAYVLQDKIKDGAVRYMDAFPSTAQKYLELLDPFATALAWEPQSETLSGYYERIFHMCLPVSSRGRYVQGDLLRRSTVEFRDSVLQTESYEIAPHDAKGQDLLWLVVLDAFAEM